MYTTLTNVGYLIFFLPSWGGRGSTSWVIFFIVSNATVHYHNEWSVDWAGICMSMMNGWQCQSLNSETISFQCRNSSQGLMLN